jgi:methyl-accepting chemotaxis protein WspA
MVIKLKVKEAKEVKGVADLKGTRFRAHSPVFAKYAQAVGAQQISETMMQLNDATQQTVESLRATSEAVHQLQYAAGDLQASVATFAATP